MCGITASIALVGRQDAPTNVFSANGSSIGNLDRQLSNSLASIHHRGPDTSCKWISHDELVGLLILLFSLPIFHINGLQEAASW